MSLSTMPVLPMSHILSYCDYFDIQCLRKTCHAIRNSIETIKPATRMEAIHLNVDHDRNLHCSFNYQKGEVSLEYCRNGIIEVYRRQNGKSKRKTVQSPDGVGYFNALMTDLRAFSEQQDCVLQNVIFSNIGQLDFKAEKFVKMQQFRTERLQLLSFEEPETYLPIILKFFDTKVLKNLKMYYTRLVKEHYDVNIVEWKSAENIIEIAE